MTLGELQKMSQANGKMSEVVGKQMDNVKKKLEKLSNKMEEIEKRKEKSAEQAKNIEKRRAEKRSARADSQGIITGRFTASLMIEKTAQPVLNHRLDDVICRIIRRVSLNIARYIFVHRHRTVGLRNAK